MSATVQAQAGPLQVLDAPDSLPAPLQFTVVFVADPPDGKHFLFRDASGHSQDPIFQLDGFQKIEIHLEDATFSEVGPVVDWILPPPAEPVHLTEMDTPTLRVFQADAPSTIFHPWIFQLAVNTPLGDSKSPAICLTKGSQLPGSGPTESFTLLFDPGTSNDPSTRKFKLQAASGDGDDVIEIDSEQLLVFTLLSGHTCQLQLGLEFDLASNPSATGTLAWGSGPILWTTSQPSWATTPTVDPGDNQQMTMTIEADGEGLSVRTAGFHFEIVFNGSSIESPDPILVNATIGDG